MNIEEYRKLIATKNNRVPNPIRQRRGRESRDVGEVFEKLIESSCEWYKASKIAFIEKTPEPMKPLQPSKLPGQFIACYTKQAQPDYKGTRAGGRSIVFEAKHTDADRMLRSRVSDEQMDALSLHSAMGASVFVLLSFGLARYYLVPWKKWENMKAEYGRLYVKPDDLLEYEVPFTGAVIKFLG